ncbi:hypothetical protein LZG04_30455 [Saccharothrix sp. S26]|uniref:hypothetical protein n=1 Tax=Saccharothrix sp. S26 TaxID=2907215 RepID=UPI001F1EFD37|nr:hypothetical protein [Saccharothrix sp. S26]MCE6999094.1 hypothetical protein [Saccharothrix sp. S26]
MGTLGAPLTQYVARAGPSSPPHRGGALAAAEVLGDAGVDEDDPVVRLEVEVAAGRPGTPPGAGRGDPVRDRGGPTTRWTWHASRGPLVSDRSPDGPVDPSVCAIAPQHHERARSGPAAPVLRVIAARVP